VVEEDNKRGSYTCRSTKWHDLFQTQRRDSQWRRQDLITGGIFLLSFS